MEDAIKEFTNDETSDETASNFAEEYPDAPQWAVSMAEQLEANRQRIDRAAKARKNRKQRWQNDLKDTIKSNAERVEVLAHAAGLVEDVHDNEASKHADDVDLDDRQKFFVPESELEYHS
jgi:hypothetical protein